MKSICQQPQLELDKLRDHSTLFAKENDQLIERLISNIKTQIRVIGPELIFGKIYDQIGSSKINEKLFPHLVISGLAYPGSKLKMIYYLYRYQGISIGIDTLYRFLVVKNILHLRDKLV